VRKIDRAEVNRLLQANEAGWYAIWANPPILHPIQMVIEIGNDYYLAGKEDFEIESKGPVIINGLLKEAHQILCYNPELTALLLADAERGKKIDVGIDVPTYHTDKLKPRGRSCPST